MAKEKQNASITQNTSIANLGMHSSEKFLAQLHTNVLGPLNVTRALLPHFRQKKSGTVLFVGSIATYIDGYPGAGPYHGSKGALESPFPFLPFPSLAFLHTSYLPYLISLFPLPPPLISSHPT